MSEIKKEIERVLKLIGCEHSPEYRCANCLRETAVLRKQDANMGLLMKLSVTAANLRRWNDRVTDVFGVSELAKALHGHSGAIQEVIKVIGQMLKEPE